MLDFKALELEHRDLLNGFLRRHPPQISEHTFTNLFAWRGSRPTALARWHDALLIVQETEGERSLLGPPVGDCDMEELLPVLTDAGVRAFRRLPKATAEQLRELGLETQSDRDNADYVYLREDLVKLAGRQYHRQKNLINQCLSAYDCTYVHIAPGILDEIVDMQDRWCEQQDCDEKPGLCNEYRAIMQTLEHFGELTLRGGAVRIGGQIEAYTIGEPLNDETAVVHFEKAMKQYNGLYQVINQWFCRHELEEFRFVNREQDLGIPGLRRAKKSYHPHHMVEKYSAAFEPARVGELVGGETEGRCRE